MHEPAGAAYAAALFFSNAPAALSFAISSRVARARHQLHVLGGEWEDALADYSALLQRDDIDAVYNALPASHHAPWTLAAKPESASGTAGARGATHKWINGKWVGRIQMYTTRRTLGDDPMSTTDRHADTAHSTRLR